MKENLISPSKDKALYKTLATINTLKLRLKSDWMIWFMGPVEGEALVYDRDGLQAAQGSTRN